MADNGDVSKAAKKRAAKKARDSAFEEQQAAEAAAAAAAAPKAKGKAKAAPAPEAAAAPKSKAKAKAKSQPEPVAPEPKALPKAAAKGKAKAKAEVAPPPPPAPAAPAPKAQGKQKAKGKAAPAPVVEEKPAEPTNTDLINYFIDDGTNADEWEAVPVQSKKRREPKGGAGYVDQKIAAQNQNVVGFAGGADTQGKNGKAGAPSQAVAADVARILAMKGEVEAAAEPAAASKSPVSSATVTVPEARVGVVIGPKGATIKLLQDKTNTKIDTSGQDFTIVGDHDDVLKCEAAIKEMVAKGFCALQYENFSENMMTIHPSCFPDLIGKQGAIVRKIKEALNVEVNFQDVPRGSPPTKKGKVTLAGKSEDVEQAKEVINSIVQYQHHELTHPGQTHEEIDIEPWSYKYIIGKAGSELKHIQHNWQVKVSIPRENSSFEKVLVVGEPDNVTRAKAYIDKVIWNAENNAKGRDKQDGTAEDPWGAEEEEEPWMKQYLYKRA